VYQATGAEAVFQAEANRWYDEKASFSQMRAVSSVG
jgi:hypothetical protein